ncbi:Uncharacterised protein [Escherichia coli]|nr:Uncharacterised protein [Escherichia coli]
MQLKLAIWLYIIHNICLRKYARSSHKSNYQLHTELSQHQLNSNYHYLLQHQK